MTRRRWPAELCALGVLVGLGACSTSEGRPMGPTAERPQPQQVSCEEAGPAPEPETLTWKRHRVFVRDLYGALQLDAESGCKELDRVPCDEIYRVPLGGNDAEGAAQFEPVASPLATTPLTVDRIVLAACANRADLDRIGPARVFDTLDLAAPALSPDEPAVAATAEKLFRLLLRRDATPEELALARDLATEGSARDFAIGVCFALGTHSENVLF